MQELKTYLAIIPYEFVFQFATVLDRISLQSNVRQGSRIETIIPMPTKTTYQVSLTDEEAIMIALSCPGIYEYCTEGKISESMAEYIDESTRS